LASTDQAPQQKEVDQPDSAPPPKQSDDEPLPATQPPAAGMAGEWTGALEKVLAVPDAAAGNPGGGAVHLIVKLDDSKDGWSMIDAVVADVAFLREIADYRSAQDGGDPDRVVVSGVSTDKLHQDKRVYADEPLPVVELKSLRKSDGSAPALAGGRRDLSLSAEEVDLAVALRTLDKEASFDAVVGDYRDSAHFVVKVDALDRQAAIAWSGLGGLTSGQTLRAGQPLRATAKVSGDTARIDPPGGEPLKLAVLSSARVVLGPAPEAVAGSSTPSAPASAPDPKPAEPQAPPARAGSPQIAFQVNAHRTNGAAVAWSPNGGLLATSGSDGLLRIWSADNGAQRQEFDESSIDGLHWSPDGQWLAAAYGRSLRGIVGMGTIPAPAVNRYMSSAYSRVAWNRVTGQAAFMNSGDLWLVLPPNAGASIPRGSGPTLNTFDFSPDGQQIAIAVTANYSAYSIFVLPFFDFVRRDWTASVRFDVPESVDHLEFREDPATGIRRVAAYIDDEVRVFRLENGVGAEEMMVDTSRYFSGAGQEVSLSADGRRLAYNSGLEVTVKEIRDGGLPNSTTVEAPQFPRAIAFAPDSVHLAVGQSGNEILIWDCAANREVAKLTGPASTSRLDWRRDGQRLAAIHSGGQLTVWDLSPVVPKIALAAPQGSGEAGIDLLEFYALSGAWEEYHKLLETFEDRKLTKDEEKAVGLIKVNVSERVEQSQRAIGALKKRFPRMKSAAPEIIGQYQFVLKEIVAMDPKNTQAKKNLAESIEESGEVPYTPP
jgi:WD40 repeat protein